MSYARYSIGMLGKSILWRLNLLLLLYIDTSVDTDTYLPLYQLRDVMCIA